MNGEPLDLNTVPRLATIFQIPVPRMHKAIADGRVAPALILNGTAYYDVAAVTPAVAAARLEELAPEAEEYTPAPAEEPIDTEEITRRWGLDKPNP